jgi:Ras-related protein Rab-8A
MSQMRSHSRVSSASTIHSFEDEETQADILDIRTWHSNIEQHASPGVNKILIGNKCDWNDKRSVSLEQGKQLADEFGLRFLETSAKANEGVEEAFFVLAR